MFAIWAEWRFVLGNILGGAPRGFLSYRGDFPARHAIVRRVSDSDGLFVDRSLFFPSPCRLRAVIGDIAC